MVSSSAAMRVKKPAAIRIGSTISPLTMRKAKKVGAMLATGRPSIPAANPEKLLNLEMPCSTIITGSTRSNKMPISKRAARCNGVFACLCAECVIVSSSFVRSFSENIGNSYFAATFNLVRV